MTGRSMTRRYARYNLHLCRGGTDGICGMLDKSHVTTSLRPPRPSTLSSFASLSFPTLPPCLPFALTLPQIAQTFTPSPPTLLTYSSPTPLYHFPSPYPLHPSTLFPSPLTSSFLSPCPPLHPFTPSSSHPPCPLTPPPCPLTPPPCPPHPSTPSPPTISPPHLVPFTPSPSHPVPPRPSTLSHPPPLPVPSTLSP